MTWALFKTYVALLSLCIIIITHWRLGILFIASCNRYLHSYCLILSHNIGYMYLVLGQQTANKYHWDSRNHPGLKHIKTGRSSSSKKVMNHMKRKDVLTFYHTVDGRNPALVELGSLSHYLHGFIHPRWWSPEFWTINSIGGSSKNVMSSWWWLSSWERAPSSWEWVVYLNSFPWWNWIIYPSNLNLSSSHLVISYTYIIIHPFF